MYNYVAKVTFYSYLYTVLYIHNILRNCVLDNICNRDPSSLKRPHISCVNEINQNQK